MNITFRQLRVFTEVAQQGSVSRAARICASECPCGAIDMVPEQT